MRNHSHEEGNYVGMLHFWEDIILLPSERKTHIGVLEKSPENYDRFLIHHSKNDYNLNLTQRQIICNQLNIFKNLFSDTPIPAGTLFMELRTDEKDQLYDKLTVIYFREDNEPSLLDEPYISKIHSALITEELQSAQIDIQLISTKNANTKLSFVIISDDSGLSEKKTSIELMKFVTDPTEGLQEIKTLLQNSIVKATFFDLRMS